MVHFLVLSRDEREKDIFLHSTAADIHTHPCNRRSKQLIYYNSYKKERKKLIKKPPLVKQSSWIPFPRNSKRRKSSFFPPLQFLLQLLYPYLINRMSRSHNPTSENTNPFCLLSRLRTLRTRTISVFIAIFPEFDSISGIKARISKKANLSMLVERWGEVSHAGFDPPSRDYISLNLLFHARTVLP